MSIYSKAKIRLRISQCNCRQNIRMLQLQLNRILEMYMSNDLLVASRANALSKYTLGVSIFPRLWLTANGTMSL